MNLNNAHDVKVAMQLAGIKPHKSLGQHFLVDEASMEGILDAAHITKEDTVLEIGPGLGVMTERLAERAGNVVAVETDPKLAELLRRRLPDSVQVVEQDILKFDLGSLGASYKVVANVPYYITSPILRLLMETATPPSLAVLLIQKEVAERLVAPPGKLSVLGFSVQYYANAEITSLVPRDKFWPAPRVDSAVIRLTPHDQPVFAADRAKLFRLVKAGFGEKRKQLRNSLAGGLHQTPEQAEQLLGLAGIDPTTRAQALTMDQWQSLYNAAIERGIL